MTAVSKRSRVERALPLAESPAALPPALQTRSLCFSYPDRPNVLDTIDLTISAGERVGLIGPNGAGKTTLFTSICGLIAPQTGSVEIFGQHVEPGQFQPRVGLIFQNPSDQLFSARVWDDVAFGLQNLGLAAEDVDRRTRDTLEAMDLIHLADRPSHHLSGGEKRMVAIASVLVMRPPLAIYDEPSANLDLRSRRRLIHFLQASRETLLVSSHDLEMILEVCDRVILLDNGSIVADGSAARIMSDTVLMESHGLERPHSLAPHIHIP
ncbi:MAG: ABC transporter ATP-binding protein [Cyanobacteria bacterium J06639_1]